jgi:hypothetical protein
MGSVTFDYDVAISFAGEQRREAEAVAACLLKVGISVFFDEYEQATLWGKDIYEHLGGVYQHKARYCLMLVSAAYAAKVWTTHERRSAQARGLTQGTEYILPVRFDDTEIPGLLPTIGYLRFQDHGAQGICDLLRQKLGIAPPAASTITSVTTSPRAVILDPQQNLQAWVPVTECTWGATTVTLLLQPDDPTDGPFLDSLRNTNHQLLIAFKNNAAQCSLTDVEHRLRDGRDLWAINLRIDNADFAPNIEMGMQGLSADQIAEQRARRILLNENISQQTNEPNDALREILLRGMQTVLQATASSFPELYRQFGTNPTRFLETAWITAAMTLKTTGVVVEVTRLELRLNGPQLSVTFSGKRRKQYSNAPAATITVNGTCKLTPGNDPPIR